MAPPARLCRAESTCPELRCIRLHRCARRNRRVRLRICIRLLIRIERRIIVWLSSTALRRIRTRHWQSVGRRIRICAGQRSGRGIGHGIRRTRLHIGSHWAGPRHRRSSRRGYVAAAQAFSAGKKLIGRHDHLRLQLVIQNPLIADFAGNKIFGDKINRRIFIPGGGDRLHDSQCFVAVFYQPNLPRAVISKIGRNGRGADFVIVHINQCARRIAANGHPPLHATALDRQ